MRFAKWTFLIAGIYGLLVLTPQFFLERRIGVDQPPPITHPEHFYGFVSVAVAWQVLFLLIGRDPVRLRPAMLPALLEKLGFAVAVPILYAQGRVAPVIVPFAALDGLLLILFLVAYLKTPDREAAAAERE
jgi:hypothetical protein